MSEKVRVHNPDRFEVVIDQAGHSLGGHAAVEVVRDSYTDALIASGALLVVAVKAPPVDDSPALEHSEQVPVTAKKTNRKQRTVTNNGNGSETGE